MNVYVRETARELGRMGVAVDVFTRSQNASIPRVADLGEGARVIHLPAGPQAPIAREVHPPASAGVHRGRRGASLGRRHRLRRRSTRTTGSRAWRVSSCASAGACRSSRCSTPWAASRTRWRRGRRSSSPSSGSPRSRASSRAPTGSSRPTWSSARTSSGTTAPSAERIAVIPCGVDTELFQPMSQAAAKDLLELPPDPMLLYVGRLEPIKGLETLLDAMARIGGAARLYIVGGDSDEPDPAHASSGHALELRSRVAALGLEDRVRFLGPQPQRRLRHLLRGGRRHRHAVLLRVVRHGGARGHGLRLPRGRLARGRAHHHGERRRDGLSRARRRCGRPRRAARASAPRP